MQELSAIDERFRATTVSTGLDIARLAQEANERGRPPEYEALLPPPHVNRMGYINLHNENVKLAKNRKGTQNTTQVNSNSTMRPHIQHGPAPPILSLQAITLREVAKKVNYIHDDRILFVKTIHEAHRIVGTNLLVEDDCGDCLLFSVYNLVPPDVDPRDVFPEGTYLALLAPYMKNSGDDPNRNLLLRCDNPECIRTFPSRRTWLAAKRGKKLIDTDGLDPGQLRKEGNEAFGKERYEVAARCYSRALQCKNIEDSAKVACFSNLSEVRLRQERWEDAELNATAALKIVPGHSKAKYRLATAHVRLNRFEEASNIIASETEKAFKRLKDDIQELLREKAGLYNFNKIHKKAARRPGQALSKFHANFTSPKIKQGVEILKPEGFSYRGSIATEKIDGNCLISSSKALVFCKDQRNSLDYSVDPYTKSLLKGSSMALETKLVLLMHQRPALRESIYSLASGLEDSDIANPNYKIDIKRLQGIVTSNTFGVLEVDGVEETWEKIKQTTQMEQHSRRKLCSREEEAFEMQFLAGLDFG